MQPSKPNQLCLWRPPNPQCRITEHGPVFRMVQTISMPFKEQRNENNQVLWHNAFKVRMVPGDPNSLADAWSSELEILPIWNHNGTVIPKFYLHYAEVWSARTRSYFPTDMCRRDRCVPDDWTLDLDGKENSDDQPQFLPSQKIRVVQISKLSVPAWTTGRWQSFGWEIKPAKHKILVRYGEAQFGEVHKTKR